MVRPKNTTHGISSVDNRKFNHLGEHAFITAQTVKKLKKYMKESVLATDGWNLEWISGTFDINRIEASKESL
jgi:hypothetical protein